MGDNPGVVKTVLHIGYRYVPITEGCKVHYHFQAWRLEKRRTLLDDSKKLCKREPATMVIGHKFKLDVWERVLKMMAVGEVASFTVSKELVFNYPFIAKTFRELDTPVEAIKHMCTMTLHKEGIGYADLDDLMKDPSDLEFIFELVKVERPGEYEKDIWQMNSAEKIAAVPILKERGNVFYGKKMYDEAEFKYKQCIGIIEQLMLREQKEDEEWINLNNQKLPLLLNYAQCRLVKGDFYAVIEHCTYVLKYDPGNEKALFRRGKAHLGVWNPEDAEEDFLRLKRINPSIASTVDKELAILSHLKKDKDDQDKNVLKKLFAECNSIPKN